MASLEELKKRLYKEGEGFEERVGEPELERKRAGETMTWKDLEPPKKEPIYIYWVGGALVILMILGAAIYFFRPLSLFEAKDVEVEILGDREVKSGARLTWQVRINNKSKRDLEDPVLVFNFPQDSTPVTGQRPAGIFRTRKPIETVKSGESVVESFDAYVFGGRESKKEVTAVLEFRPKGMSAIFGSDAEFSFFIARAPISVSFAMPKELRMGQKIDFSINYLSQADETVKDLFLDAFFPDGFEFVSASPQALAGEQKRWRIGDLKPNDSGSIKITGVIKGGDLESKVFRASLGSLDSQKKSLLPYDEVTNSIVLRSPFLEVSLKSDGKNEIVVFPGSEVSVDVFWKNNLEREVRDAILEVKLEGLALDFRTIEIDKGVFKEATKSATWNTSTYAPFKNVAPGDSGSFRFVFRVKSNLPLDSQSPRYIIKATARFRSGTEVTGLEGVDLSGSSSLEAKVASRIQLASRGAYFNSIIPNTGPIPPKVGEETTYTITWSITNMVNDIDGAVVKSSLPPYVNFKEAVSPADADIFYNPNSGEIEWKIGKILAGTGFLRPAVQVAFQIGIIPSSSQIGGAPLVADEARLEGRDIFTSTRLSAEAGKITTEMSGDPGVGYEKGKVVP